jgi:precorrin-2 dehydrogenase/sirohydrochlorin ferrochelatase
MGGYLPISLKVVGRPCIVVGGGKVAERKVRSLLECGASITVISPSLTSGLDGLALEGRIRHLAREYCRGDLAGAFLAIAATNDRMANRAAVEEARGSGVLVSDSTDGETGDFIFPATLRRGDLTISVSTSGASPLLAKQIRDELATLYGEECGRILQTLRDTGTSVSQNAPSGLSNPAAGSGFDNPPRAINNLLRVEEKDHSGERDRKRAILIVDHGSRLAEANDMLVSVANMIKASSPDDIVHYAHMELAEPTVEQGFDDCVRDGAEEVVVSQYFLSPGRHSTQDIPRLVSEAASRHPGVLYRVSEPLGLHQKIIEAVLARVNEGRGR